MAAKNKYMDELNFVIQNQIVGTLHSCKSIDCVTNESHQLSIWIFKLLGRAWIAATQFTAEGCLGGHDASKPKPTKTMQWNAFGDKKLMVNVIQATTLKRKIQT